MIHGCPFALAVGTWVNFYGNIGKTLLSLVCEFLLSLDSHILLYLVKYVAYCILP